MTDEPNWAHAKGVAGEAIRQFVAQVGDPYRIDHTVQVTSFGGAGTTALVDHLVGAGVDLQRGPAQWPFKHWRWPPDATDVPAGFRVVYLISDPRDAVLSIFRRDLQLGHYAALHDVEPTAEVASDLEDLETFLRRGIDHFALADHVERWSAPPPGYPVLMLHYDHLGAEWERLCEFVGIDTEPRLEVRHRRSDWRSAPAPIRDRLDFLYGPLAGTVDRMAPSRLIGS